MSISLHIDLQRQVKIFAVSDNFHFHDFFQAWRHSIQHPDHSPQQSMIWDLTELNPTCLLESDLQRIANFLQGQNQVDNFVVNVALIAPTQATYGLASTYLNFILEDHVNIAIFRTMDTAQQWLIDCSTPKEAQANEEDKSSS